MAGQTLRLGVSYVRYLHVGDESDTVLGAVTGDASSWPPSSAAHSCARVYLASPLLNSPISTSLHSLAGQTGPHGLPGAMLTLAKTGIDLQNIIIVNEMEGFREGMKIISTAVSYRFSSSAHRWPLRR